MKSKIVAIELTNYCNLRCRHCPNGKLDVSYGYMSEETFRKALKYTEGYTELNWRGEPLLHPRLVDFIKIAYSVKPDLNLGLHTNAIKMTKDLFSNLAESGLKWIQFSLHSKKSCKKYLEAVNWNAELNNPIRIYAEVDTKEEEAMVVAQNFSRDMYGFVGTANWAGYLTDDKIINENPTQTAQNCLFIRDNIFLLAWNGEVNACCWDFDMKHRLGSIDEFEKVKHKTVYEKCKYCIWNF